MTVRGHKFPKLIGGASAERRILGVYILLLRGFIVWRQRGDSMCWCDTMDLPLWLASLAVSIIALSLNTNRYFSSPCSQEMTDLRILHEGTEISRQGNLSFRSDQSKNIFRGKKTYHLRSCQHQLFIDSQHGAYLWLRLLPRVAKFEIQEKRHVSFLFKLDPWWPSTSSSKPGSQETTQCLGIWVLQTSTWWLDKDCIAIRQQICHSHDP